MNRLTTVLATTLALQLALSAALFWPRENPGESDARLALVSVTADQVDKLIISSGEESLLLQRAGSGWVMPDYHGLPVQASRLNRVLVDLPALPRGWPVAGSDTAASRFQVAADAFQRRVEFYRGEDSQGALYVGTSPGFRKVHVRPAEASQVYAVAFNSFELPVVSPEWLDKSLLQLRDVTAIEGLDYQLTREGDRWLGGEAEPSTELVDTLVNGLTSLRVTGAADIATASLLADLSAPPTLQVTAGGERYAFRLYEMDDNYFIQREDIPVFFSLSALDYDRLNDVNAESLYAAPRDSEENSNDGETDGGAD